MSQNKDTVDLEASASVPRNDSSLSNSSSAGGKLQTRRTSNRSPQAASLTIDEAKSPLSASSVADKNSEEPPQPQIGTTTATAASTPTASNGPARVTRSQSVESTGNETTESRKRKRKSSSKSNTSNKKRAESHSSASSNQISNSNGSNSANSSNITKSANNSNSNQDNERETRTSAHRQSKEAKEAKKAEREAIIKERLRQLEEVEQAVKDGTHAEYHKLLHDIEAKRAKMLGIAEMRRSFAEGNVLNFFNSQKYAAYSQYYWDKLALRRSLIQQVQQKMNMLEQEYYSNHAKSSLDDDRLSEWVPPDRPSMISSLTLGLPEEEADNDVELARQDPNEGYCPPHANPSQQQQQQLYQYAYTPQQQQQPERPTQQLYQPAPLPRPPLPQHQQQTSSYPTMSTSAENQSQVRPYPNDNDGKPFHPPPPPNTTTSNRTTTSKTRNSPPLDMLASLADRQYQKDFNDIKRHESPFTNNSNVNNSKELLPTVVNHPSNITPNSNMASNSNEPATSSFTLPPINTWRYEQRPSLPTT